MWRSVSASILTLFVLCSWFWTIGVPMLRNEVITTNLEVNVIQQSGTPLDNTSSGGPDRTLTEARVVRVGKARGGTQYMLDLYRKYEEDQLSGNREGQTVDIVRSLTPRRTASVLSKDSVYRVRERRHLLVFDIPACKRDETLRDAQLRLLIRKDRQHTEDDSAATPAQVSILYADNILHDATVKPHDTDADAWMTFNVTSAVVTCCDVARRWTALKLVVRLEDDAQQASHDVETLLLLSYSTHSLPSTTPSPPGRRKRSMEAEDYEEESNNLWDDDLLTSPRVTSSTSASLRARRLRNTCRRRPLHVDFSEIHYDTWIVAPHGYEAFQCLGKCFFPVGEHLSPTKHAIVQTLVHSVSPGKVSRACCVPTRLEPISVLYIDQRGVLTYRFNYQDMVVAECGCR